MTEFDLLLHCYLEDRESLAPAELDELIAALRADSELALSLREQLVLDDLLSQKLVLDRRNFVAQVEQRIADLNRGHESLDREVADLRSLAAAERSTWWNAAAWPKVLLAVAAIAVVTVGVFSVPLLTTHDPPLAKVTAVEGEVTREYKGESEAVEVNAALDNGQHIVVPQGGLIKFAYEDGTELRVKGESSIRIGAEDPTGQKQIRIERGEVVASVKPQIGGPMKFETPHAVATGTMTVMRLVVTEESTLLDVSEGLVKFDRLTDKRSMMIATSESGMASRDTLQIRQLQWPDRRDGLKYLFSPLEMTPDNGKPVMVTREPETNKMRPVVMEPRGAAALRESRLFLELNGGYMISQETPDIFAPGRAGTELTLEAIFSPASLDQVGNARIVSLADESDAPDFALTQDGCDVTFNMKTDTPMPPASQPRVTMNSSDVPLHLTVTCRHGELIAYRDGTETARWKDLWGSLAAWKSGPLTVGADASGEHPWRGILEAFALYNRCLEPGEVARNARNYRLLARGEM